MVKFTCGPSLTVFAELAERTGSAYTEGYYWFEIDGIVLGDPRVFVDMRDVLDQATWLPAALRESNCELFDLPAAQLFSAIHDGFYGSGDTSALNGVYDVKSTIDSFSGCFIFALRCNSNVAFSYRSRSGVVGTAFVDLSGVTELFAQLATFISPHIEG